MDKIALDGFWLLGGLALVYLTGVFTAQYVKDKVSGVPSALRAALKATETNALAELEKAKNAVLADIGNIFKKSAAATTAAAPAAAAVAAAPASAAAPAASASVAAKS
jgi:type IV secretory pathway TrbL component